MSQRPLHDVVIELADVFESCASQLVSIRAGVGGPHPHSLDYVRETLKHVEGMCRDAAFLAWYELGVQPGTWRIFHHRDTESAKSNGMNGNGLNGGGH